MIKVSHFLGEDAFGLRVIPLFGAADSYFEKTAAPQLLSPVVRYIENLRPSNGSAYVLVNAMGAAEYYGSNINGDAFREEYLTHAPDDWRNDPVIDKVRGRQWPYGYPTFYDAYPYAHHRNKDPKRAFGEVELAVWNPHMHRVELVCRVDKDKCEQFGGVPVWDKIKAGYFPDVSMGCRVPFDTCSICLDWKLYHEAQATFDPKKHKHEGQAVLEFHKQLKEKNGVGIRGLSITRKDYCEHADKQMSRIFADGRKVWVYNDYAHFFDISFVFVGADRTAKMMLKIAEAGAVYSIPSAKVAEDLGYMGLWREESTTRAQFEKAASAEDMWLKFAFLGKDAKLKRSEIIKDVVPDQFKGKAIALSTANEKDLPKSLLNQLAERSPLEQILSTSGGLGMVLRPREFQRIILIQVGRKDLADDFDKKNITFPKVEEKTPVPMGPQFFSKVLASLLGPFFDGRSALGPALESRLALSVVKEEDKPKTKTSSQDSELLRKIGSAYAGYRSSLMELVAHAQPLIDDATGLPDDLKKVAAAETDEVFTPLVAAYLQTAFWDEAPSGKTWETT